jgi:DNA-binding transcriptional ArsR family regulator
MNGTPNLAAIGQIIGDPTRSLILEMLYDGRAWSASELAGAAGITPQTASSHLHKLVDANLLAVEAEGRNRYYRIADSEVADALEALMVLAMRRKQRPEIVSVKDDPMRHARTCYDHIAGRFGIDLIDQLIDRNWLQDAGDSYLLTPEGETLMTRLDIDVAALRGGRRPLTRKCLDWSERRHHLGGALGAAVDGSRALKITPEGRRQLGDLGLYSESL